MTNELLSRAAIMAVILLVGLPVLYAGISWLWNKKYVPARLIKGQQVKSFGFLMKEINAYTFKEDNATLAPKAPKIVRNLLSLKSIHIIMMIVGCLGYVIFNNPWMLSLFALSFIIGISRSLPMINKRSKTLERIFLIASSSIKFTSGVRAKNAPPPAWWNHIQVEEWEGVEPSNFIMTFPPGNAPDQFGQRSFEKSFTENITTEHDWHTEWDPTHDRVTVKAVASLPTTLAYPGSQDVPWSVFPVGLSKGGVASFDLATFPHVLIGGPSGTGKSVLQRNIVFHTIEHNYRWRFLGVDLKRVELTPYNAYKKTVMGIATEVDQGLEVLKYAYNEMMDRYKMMEGVGVNNLMDLDDPPYCILLMVDEATMFLGASGSKTDEGKAEDAMKAEASDLVGKILRLGRAAGIHMVIAMQRPDATVLRGEFKANMDVRLAAGRMDSTPSSMILDSGEAVNLPGIKGRGLLRVGGSLDVFQGYFAPPSWIDSFIMQNPEVEPTTIAPGGHLHEKYKAQQAATGQPMEEQQQQVLTMEKNEPSYPTPDFLDEEPELDPAQNQLLSALNPQPTLDNMPSEERTSPTFFNNSQPTVTQSVVPEPELNLTSKDFILDDFDMEESVEATENNPTASVQRPTLPSRPSAGKALPQRPNPNQVNAPAEVPESNTTPQRPQRPTQTIKPVKPSMNPLKNPFA